MAILQVAYLIPPLSLDNNKTDNLTNDRLVIQVKWSLIEEKEQDHTEKTSMLHNNDKEDQSFDGETDTNKTDWADSSEMFDTSCSWKNNNNVTS